MYSSYIRFSPQKTGALCINKRLQTSTKARKVGLNFFTTVWDWQSPTKDYFELLKLQAAESWDALGFHLAMCTHMKTLFSQEDCTIVLVYR